MNPALPPLVLAPGWYWWIKSPAEDAAYSAFWSANRLIMKPRKILRGQSETNELIVFEVLAPLPWTLPGPPSRAPKGQRTELDDIIKGPAPDPHWTVQLGDLLGKPWQPIRDAGNAVKVLVFGGAAVLLFNLYQNTKRQEEQREELRFRLRELSRRDPDDREDEDEDELAEEDA